MRSRLISALFASCLVATPAQAGWLLTGGLAYQTFAFRPLADEATPNYHGYGLELGGGYSLGRIVDAQLYGNFAPSRLKSAKFNSDEAVMLSYGGILGVRIAETVYVGIGGGPHSYELKTQTRAEEVPGTWRGTGAFVTVGAFSKIDRQSFTQLAVRFGTSTLERSDQVDVNKRKVDTFAVTMTYLWNAEDRFKLSDSIITDFVDSLNFF